MHLLISNSNSLFVSCWIICTCSMFSKMYLWRCFRLDDISEDHRELEFTVGELLTPVTDVSSSVPSAQASLSVHMPNAVSVSVPASQWPRVPEQSVLKVSVPGVPVSCMPMSKNNTKSAPCDHPTFGQLALTGDATLTQEPSISATSFPSTVMTSVPDAALITSIENNSGTSGVDGQVVSVPMAVETCDHYVPVTSRPVPTIVIEEY